MPINAPDLTLVALIFEITRSMWKIRAAIHEAHHVSPNQAAATSGKSGNQKSTQDVQDVANRDGNININLKLVLASIAVGFAIALFASKLPWNQLFNKLLATAFKFFQLPYVIYSQIPIKYQASKESCSGYENCSWIKKSIIWIAKPLSAWSWMGKTRNVKSVEMSKASGDDSEAAAAIKDRGKNALVDVEKNVPDEVSAEISEGTTHKSPDDKPGETKSHGVESPQTALPKDLPPSQIVDYAEIIKAKEDRLKELLANSLNRNPTGWTTSTPSTSEKEANLVNQIPHIIGRLHHLENKTSDLTPHVDALVAVSGHLPMLLNRLQNYDDTSRIYSRRLESIESSLRPIIGKPTAFEKDLQIANRRISKLERTVTMLESELMELKRR